MAFSRYFVDPFPILHNFGILKKKKKNSNVGINTYLMMHIEQGGFYCFYHISILSTDSLSVKI